MVALIFYTAAMIHVNYDEKQLAGKKNFELFLLSVQVS
jgi:hypothetical protein